MKMVPYSDDRFELTPEVREELGWLKSGIVQTILPHWEKIAGCHCDDVNIDVLDIELDGRPSPDFIRALAAALKASYVNTKVN